MTKEEIELWESRLGSAIENPHEFMEGQRDCKKGNKYRYGMGRDYRRGYSAYNIHTENMSNLL